MTIPPDYFSSIAAMPPIAGQRTVLAEALLVAPRYTRRVYEILEVAAPHDLASRLFDAGLALLIALNILALSLESVAPIQTRFSATFFWFEMFSVCVFSIEYLLRIWSCVGARESASKSRLLFRLRFAMRPMVIIDLLSILPFYLGMMFNLDLRFLRAMRLLRVLKLTRYSPAATLLIRTIHQEREALSAAMFFLVIVLTIAASGIYMFENRAQPEAFASIPAAVWWAITTLTTVGYGDVTPITVGGKAFGMCIMIIGIGMVALPTAILASAFSDQLRNRREEYQDMVDVALEDGIVSAPERSELEHIRKRLGMGPEEAERILKQELQGFVRARRSCPHCGHKQEIAETD